MPSWPSIEETAVLTVNGRDYRDWESVSVTHRMNDTPPFLCRFTCSEGVPYASNLAKMQIKPSDVCTVTLAGVLAFSGKVVTRQVFLDANRHHIEIFCATGVDVNSASVLSRTMEWKNATFAEIAKSQLDRLGRKLVFEGGSPPDYRFPRVSAMHGESIFNFLDTLARSLSAQSGIGIAFTSNVQGDFVVALNASPGNASIVEGGNMIIGREVLYSPSAAGSSPVLAQGPGSDQKHGPKITHMPFADQKSNLPFLASPLPSVILNEKPTADIKQLQGRASTDLKWQGEEHVTVTCTVRGWLKPGGGLWEKNKIYTVHSPALIMDNEPLRSKSVTFSQDNRTGTRTTLELCNPAAIGGGTPAIK